MNCNSEIFESGAYVIAYKGKDVGISLDKPRLKMKAGLYEAKSERIGSKSVCKIITDMKITLFVKVKEVNDSFAALTDTREKSGGVIFNPAILETGGELRFSSCAANGGECYCFLKAVLIPGAAYACRKSRDNHIGLEFEVYENAEGILIRKLSD